MPTAIAAIILSYMVACLAIAQPAPVDAVKGDGVADQQQEHLQCTMLALFLGLIAEDADVVRAFLYIENDDKDSARQAQTRRLIANVRFVRAASKFDISHDNPFQEFHIFGSDDFAFAFLAGDWKIEGNRATVPPDQRMGGEAQPSPPPLINVRGVWKVNLTPAEPPEAMRELAARIDRYTDVLEKTTADITAGKFKTAEEIKGALRQAPRLESLGSMPPLVLAMPRELNSTTRKRGE